MNSRKLLNKKRARRVLRTRAKIFGSASKPRLAIFRSNSSIYAQLIDDEKGNTLVHASSRELRAAGKKAPKTEVAKLVGELLAKKAKEKGIKEAVFDRRNYKYHGRVRAVGEGARSGGLKI